MRPKNLTTPKLKPLNLGICISLATALLSFSAASKADTTLIYHHTTGGEANRILITPEWIKIANKTQANVDVLFNQSQQTYTLINHDERSYTLMTHTEIEKLANASQQIDDVLEKQLAKLPADQQEKMRAMMQGIVNSVLPKATSIPQYSKTGKMQKLYGYTCQPVKRTVEGKASGEFCVVNYAQLDISQVEYSMMAGLMNTIEKLASQFGQDQSVNFATIGQVVPVYYNMANAKSYLAEVTNSDIKPAEFSVPKTYKKSALPLNLL
ncbi:hypothetical protein [Thiomicrorhabdus aquaedulcis]|uniref:hypothetical protein n=1 Tax=Thiomicrorhabdus aquaedulcis TaxID=2211106 RepID=UPI000FD82F97|nr:hypothetical protein [Thiomicrorhabdus aquaedulcis]